MTGGRPRDVHLGPGGPVEAARAWLDLYGENRLEECWELMTEEFREAVGDRYRLARYVLPLVAGYDPQTWAASEVPQPLEGFDEGVVLAPPEEWARPPLARAGQLEYREATDALLFVMHRAPDKWLVHFIERRRREEDG